MVSQWFYLQWLLNCLQNLIPVLGYLHINLIFFSSDLFSRYRYPIQCRDQLQVLTHAWVTRDICTTDCPCSDWKLAVWSLGVYPQEWPARAMHGHTCSQPGCFWELVPVSSFTSYLTPSVWAAPSAVHDQLPVLPISLPLQPLLQLYQLILLCALLLPLQNISNYTAPNYQPLLKEQWQYWASVLKCVFFHTDGSVFLYCTCMGITMPASSHMQLLGSRKSNRVSSGLLIPVPASICIIRGT